MGRKRALIVIVGAIAVVALGAAPAFAHDALVTGTVTCTPAGNQLVTWSNQQAASVWGNTFITASNRDAVATGTMVPPTGSVVVGTETFGPAATQTLTLTESWRWVDGATDTASGSVTLGIDCNQPTSPPPTTPPPTTPPPTTPPPTTPPPTTPPPTTPPPTTTTPPPTTTTPPATTPPSGTGSSTTSGPPSATSGSTTPGTAFTGMSSAPLVGLGVFLILGLAGLAISRRKVDEV